VAFGVRKNAPKLRIELNKWLSAPAEKEARRQIAEAYVRSAMGGGPIRQLRTIQFATDSISPFDSLFQAHAGGTAVDWRLLAAMGRKESRFDTSATSHAGAQGLMQIMPSTAASLGIDGSASGSIKGASLYISSLDTFWRNSIKDRDQRLKFTLASYNAGPGHIKDAQRVAELVGLDPHRWDGHVEKAVLILSMPRYFCLPEVKNGACRGHETFWYVRDVLATLSQYRSGGVK
jgi:membrane-bound lytic murein transglycosylase F